MDLNLPQGRNRDEWQVAIWNLSDDFVSRPQKLQFMLMLEHEFNNFDPFRVVGDLLRHRSLWDGVIMDRGSFLPADRQEDIPWLSGNLIKLRDIGSGVWNVDQLFVLTDRGEAEWQRVVEGWTADEVRFIGGREAEALLRSGRSRGRARVLTVWWD